MSGPVTREDAHEERQRASAVGPASGVPSADPTLTPVQGRTAPISAPVVPIIPFAPTPAGPGVTGEIHRLEAEVRHVAQKED